MKHRLTFSTDELLVIREAIHSITLKGNQAVVVGGLLEKVYRGIDKAIQEEEKKKKKNLDSDKKEEAKN